MRLFLCLSSLRVSISFVVLCLLCRSTTRSDDQSALAAGEAAMKRTVSAEESALDEMASEGLLSGAESKMLKGIIVRSFR